MLDGALVRHNSFCIFRWWTWICKGKWQSVAWLSMALFCHTCSAGIWSRSRPRCYSTSEPSSNKGSPSLPSAHTTTCPTTSVCRYALLEINTKIYINFEAQKLVKCYMFIFSHWKLIYHSSVHIRIMAKAVLLFQINYNIHQHCTSQFWIFKHFRICNKLHLFLERYNDSIFHEGSNFILSVIFVHSWLFQPLNIILFTCAF